MNNTKTTNLSKKKIWFVSRHEGAINWAKRQQLPITHWCTHLSINQISSKDVVIGTLPIHLAAQVCQTGAIFYFLQVSTPEHLRGMELSESQMQECGCQLTRFEIKTIYEEKWKL